MSQIASTYKARDVEEVIDIYFYRPLGYFTAVVSRTLGLTPNMLTVSSMVVGVLAGPLFYRPDIVSNIWGIVCWIIADIFDSADGQLARMTNHKSKIGRILDGFATNIIFASMYLGLYARMVQSGYTPWWFPIVLLSGASHSMQSAISDYYRNAYLRFVVGPTKAELHRSHDVIAEYKSISFRKEPVRKVLFWFYRNYTIQQESVTPKFQRLRDIIDQRFGNSIPPWFAEEYRKANLPQMKYYAILTTNTRMIAMAVFVLLDHPLWYFLFETIFINLVMAGVVLRHESLSAQLIRRIEMEHAAA